MDVFVSTSVGERVKLARMQTKRTTAETASLSGFGSDALLNEIEAGKSPLEKYGALIGRAAVKLRCPVSSLLTLRSTTPEATYGGNLLAARTELCFSTRDLCRAVTIRRGRTDASAAHLEARPEEPTTDDPSYEDRDEFFVSEREMLLIESGGHPLFERWMGILVSLSNVTRVDAFSLVVGV